MSEESSLFKIVSDKNQRHVLKPWEYTLAVIINKEKHRKNGNIQNSLSEPKCKKP